MPEITKEQSEFLGLIEAGDLKNFELKIGRGFNIFFQDQNLETPLHYAAFYGRAEILAKILSIFVNKPPYFQTASGWLNQKSAKEGYTALHMAVREKRLVCVETLLKEPKIDTTIADNAANLAEHWAANINFNLKILESNHIWRLFQRHDLITDKKNQNGFTSRQIYEQQSSVCIGFANTVEAGRKIYQTVMPIYRASASIRRAIGLVSLLATFIMLVKKVVAQEESYAPTFFQAHTAVANGHQMSPNFALMFMLVFAGIVLQPLLDTPMEQMRELSCKK